MGREFPLGLVRQVITQPEDQLHRLLSSLQHKEFLYEQPAFPEVEYIFKHALTQEVAYNSVLLERRKVLHEQTARAIEQIDHDRLEEHYSELAHHYSRSGNAEKAIEYLHKAGQQAMQQSANAEAIRHVMTALELLTTFPETPERMEQELTLRLALGPPLIATQGYAAPEVVQHYSRARVLCEQLADSSRLVTVLWGLSVSHLVRGELRMAQAFAEECVQCAEQTSDVSLLLQASYAAGTALLWGGEYARARTAFEAGITRSQSDQQRHRLTLYGEQDHEVGGVAYLAVALWFLGYPAQALARTTEALRLAREESTRIAWG